MHHHSARPLVSPAGFPSAVRSRRFRVPGGALTSTLLFSSIASSFSKGRNKPQKTKSYSRSSNESPKFGSSVRRVTDVLVALNVALFGLQCLTGDALLIHGAKINRLISQGQIWRLLTCTFLHADIVHLAMNCYALMNLGPYVEITSGSPRFATIYIGSAIAGSLASYLLSPATSIGASGAIFGTAGALAMYFWRHRKMIGPSADRVLEDLREAAAINLMYGLIIRRIDNWGHLGGLLGGSLLSYLLGPRLRRITSKNKVLTVDQPILPIFGTKIQRRR